MKNSIKLILLLVLMMTLLIAPVSAAAQPELPELKVQVNGETIGFKAPLILEKARTLVPLEGIFEKLNAQVTLDKENQGKIYIEDEYTRVELAVDDTNALVHKKYDFSGIPLKVTLDVAPKNVKGIVYIPLRFVAESLGAKVAWDGKTRTAIVSTEGDIIPVERPVAYTLVTQEDIMDNAELVKWYETNYITKGIYSFKTEKDTYILVSAGEKSTGGYSLEVESATEVSPGSLYLTAKVTKPARDADVTMVLTYPNVLIKIENQFFEIVDGDIME